MKGTYSGEEQALRALHLLGQLLKNRLEYFAMLAPRSEEDDEGEIFRSHALEVFRGDLSDGIFRRHIACGLQASGRTEVR